MKQNFYKMTVVLLFLLSTFEEVQGQNKSNVINDPTEPILIDAPELKNLNFDLSTGGNYLLLIIAINKDKPVEITIIISNLL